MKWYLTVIMVMGFWNSLMQIVEFSASKKSGKKGVVAFIFDAVGCVWGRSLGDLDDLGG